MHVAPRSREKVPPREVAVHETKTKAHTWHASIISPARLPALEVYAASTLEITENQSAGARQTEQVTLASPRSLPERREARRETTPTKTIPHIEATLHAERYLASHAHNLAM